MTPWRPFEKQESTVPDGIWIAGTSREDKGDFELQTVAPKVAFPARPGVVKTWVQRRRNALDQAATIYAGMILAITFVGFSAIVGYAGARLLEVAWIIFS